LSGAGVDQIVDRSRMLRLLHLAGRRRHLKSDARVRGADAERRRTISATIHA